MRKGFYLAALTPLLLAGWESEPVVTTTSTTTETRQEVLQTQGDRVVGRQVVVTRTPPALRVETETVAPGPGYAWTRGYWRWTGRDYVWVSGTWVSRPRPAAVWVQGQWIRSGGGWVYVSGHWQ